MIKVDSRFEEITRKYVPSAPATPSKGSSSTGAAPATITAESSRRRFEEIRAKYAVSTPKVTQPDVKTPTVTTPTVDYQSYLETLDIGKTDRRIRELEQQIRAAKAADSTVPMQGIADNRSWEEIYAESEAKAAKIRPLEKELQQLKNDRERARAAQYDKKGSEKLSAVDSDTLSLLDALRPKQETPTVEMQGVADNRSWEERYAQSEAVYAQARAALRQKGYTDSEITELVKHRQRQTNRQNYDAEVAKSAKEAAERPGAASLKSVPQNLTGGLGFLSLAAQKANRALTGSDTPLDYYTPEMVGQAKAQTTRETVSSQLGTVGAFLYNTGMSMADSTAIALMTMAGVPAGVGTTLLGGSAATSATVEAKKRGVSDEQALMTGLSAGIAEGVFEKYSLDKLLQTKPAVGTLRQTLKQTVYNMGIQGTVEGSEELATSVANTLADAIINGDHSEYQKNLQTYLITGHSAEEARKLANRDWLRGIAGDFLGGFLSGGVMGGAGSFINRGRADADAASASRSDTSGEKPSTVTPGELRGAQSATAAQDAPELDPGTDLIMASINGGISSNKVNAMAKDSAALRELGIDANGKTASQLRAEVRAALAQRNGTGAAQSQQTPERDTLANIMFGPETQNTAVSEETTGNSRLTPTDLDDYMQVGARQHVRNQKAEMTARGDSPILTKAAEVVDFIRRSFSGEIRNTIKAYGRVGTRFAEKVHAATNGGVDIGNYYLELDSNMIAHIGDHVETDKDSRNIPLTVEQLEQLPEYIDTFDDLLDVIRRKDGSVRLMLGKKINGHSIIIEAVSKGRQALHPITAYQVDTAYYEQNYKPKAVDRSSTSQPAYADHVDISRPATTFGDTVSQNEQVVNSADATNTVGAAAQGFETPGSRGIERTSNINTGVARYTTAERDATARTRSDYDAMFRYTTQTEAQSEQQADNLLYVDMGGKRTFLKDYDAAAYDDMVHYLTDAPAWNGVMTDAAMKIKHELQDRSINGEISEDEYTSWLMTMREHATETGRGTQAWAKWTRGDNRSGEATELEAWETLQESNLSEEEQRERFDAIIRFDLQIEAAQADADLRNIIIELAEQRGTLSGITGKQSRKLRGLAQRSLENMSTAELKQFAYASSAALAKDGVSANTGAKMKTIQILNMLSNPKTAAKNALGNTSFYVLDALSMDGAALLDMALSKATGTRSVAFEQFALGRQGRKAISDAIKLSLAEVTMDVDMGGGNRYQTGRSRTFKAEGTGVFNTGTAADKFVERVLSVLERNMDYLMTTTDEAFKGAARSTAQRTQALVDSGKIAARSADYAQEQAESLAAYRTFQQDGKVAAAIQAIHDVLNLVGVGDSGKQMGRGKLTVHSFGAGDLVAPFTKVAGNLASVGVDYSPVNAVKGFVEILDTVRYAVTGKSVDPKKQAKAVSDFARGMTGTAMAYAVSLAAGAGLIRRADDEDDEDVAALNKSEGMVGTQVNIDAVKRWADGGDATWRNGDTLIDTSNLEPINFIISLGVAMADNGNDGFISTFFDGETYKDTVTSSLDAAGDLPILSGVADFARDTMVYKKPVLESAAGMLGKTAISSVTPNVVAALAKGLDDKQRSTYSSDEEGAAGVRDVLIDTILSRLPVARESLPTTVNTLGEEVENPGTVAQRLLNAMLNPIGVNQYNQSNVSREMERVRKATGETDFYPTTRKPSSLSYTDKSGEKHIVELNYEQRQKFQVACSAAQMRVAADMMGNGHYRSATAQEQADLLKRVYDYAYYYAKASVMGEDSVDSWVLNSQKAQQDLGISQTDFMYYYEKYGGDVLGGGEIYEKTKRMVAAGLSIDQWAQMKAKVNTDDKKNVTKAETMAYIEANFPRSQWNAIFTAYKGSNNWNNPYD